MKLSAFKMYLETLITQHVDIQSFVWGDAFETLQQLLQGKETPLAMVESPDIVPSDAQGSGKKRIFQSEISVLHLANEDSKSNVIDLTLEIITEIDRKLEEEFQNNVFEKYSLKSNITQVSKNNHYGWRVMFEISYDLRVYQNLDKWQLQS